MTGNLKLGIIGLGVGVTGHVPASRIEGFDVVALSARTEDKLNEAADRLGVAGRYTKYEELLANPDIDAVAITSQPEQHREMVLKALAAGKHVLLEKPLAITTDVGAELLAAAKASGKTVMIAHAFRHGPARAYVKSLIEQGYIGKLQGVSLTFFMGPKERPPSGGPRTHWRSGMETGGGFSNGPMQTFFDSVIDWFGPVKAISGRTIMAHAGAVQADGRAADADESVTASFEMANGAWGSIAASVVAPFGQGGRISLIGTEGSLEIVQPMLVATDIETVSGGRFDDGPQIKPLEIPASFVVPAHDDDPKPGIYRAYRPLYRDFAAGIAAGTSLSPNFEDGFQLQRISNALQESNRTGAWVNV